MAEILLFGATGYTGRLTAHALASRGARFAVAGRDPRRLEALARECGAADVHMAHAGDVDSLTRALRGARVLISCVGPFVELGDTAVEAALRAGVHYVDSCGEAPFIARLLEERSQAAAQRGVALAPAMGFDEVVADVAVTLAAKGLNRPAIDLTYAVPSTASAGTLKSVPGILVSPGRWVVDGRVAAVRAGERDRWAPMPGPLGPRRATSFPFAEGYLAPLHLDLEALRLFVTAGTFQRYALKAAVPVLRTLLALPAAKRAADRLLESLSSGQCERSGDDRARPRFTLLAEARAGDLIRNVVLTGADVYGLSAELLAFAALQMTEPGYDRTGVLAPVQAAGLEKLTEELRRLVVKLETHGTKEEQPQEKGREWVPDSNSPRS